MSNKRLNLDFLREKLQSLGLSSADVARELNVSREAVSTWLNGEIFPRPDKLLRLTNLLDVSFEDLVNHDRKLTAPQVAFRKNGKVKIQKEDQSKAVEIGEGLRFLVPYLPHTLGQRPALWVKPDFSYETVQEIANSVREWLGVHNIDKVPIPKVLDAFQRAGVIVVPVLWGEKSRAQGLHIYLPDSQTTWVYVNLDSKKCDFLFWLLHELGHVILPTSADVTENDESFIDNLAGAIAFPHSAAEQFYPRIMSKSTMSKKIEEMAHIANEFGVAPATICRQIASYASYTQKTWTDILSNVHKAHNILNDKQTVAESLFRTSKPEVNRYIQGITNEYKSPFFDCLKAYLKETNAGFPVVQKILGMSLADSQAITFALKENTHG